MTDSDVREEIMLATYEALCEHGYSELTAQSIADKTDKSKSLLFYHYDSKEELVAEFIEYLVDWFDERVDKTTSLPPVDRLATVVDWFLYGSANDTDKRQSFHTAMLELRTQAPYHEPYRENLRKSDDYLRELIEDILQDGIDAGQFVDHDTEEMATLLMATLDGARIRQLTLDRDSYVDQVRSAAIDRIFDDILADDVDFPETRTQRDGYTVTTETAVSTDADTDADTDANSDTSTDTGTGTDTDTGTGTDTDTDTGTDIESNTTSDTN
ncbi:TetR family transcriptional regulator [Natrialba magadii ATCC 43099]|uniref:TetR family transcriptional regulator n=1 Tax=Natrialba magadii (strain ATCC 43099 / DSM 3394 / CCM 3739 / CIP 104546 / IAM 13178 / JCM 8861 / NBRC 102185 / NCIMB 2190 / MS3) TaxID=547559 RepID=L9UGF1_NATMM|nr:TetR/AcrR family transcriptional regulator [Natrialba magadii]ELY23944.1 TetR family transcriptional regulator [Natrialba magadii ATCC 43099]